MFHYKIYGLTIASEIELKEAIVAEFNEPAQVTICYGVMPEFIWKKYKESYNRSICRQQYSWIYYEGVGHFLMKGGSEIIIQLDTREDMKHVRAILLGYCLATILYQKNIIGIHASAVVMENQVVLVSGLSGAGKSTITSKLMELGYSMLSDDLVAVQSIDGRMEAVPAYPQQKLCRDTALNMGYQLEQLERLDEEREKYAVRLEKEFVTTPKPILSLIVMEKYNGTELKIEKIEGSQKISELIGCLYNIDYYNIEGLETEVFRQLILLAKQIHILHIRRPIQQDTTQQIVDTIIESVADVAGNLQEKWEGDKALCQQSTE